MSEDEGVTLFADGLLSKWGFGDGDVLDDWLWDHGFGEVEAHPVLELLVRRHLIPVLQPEVTIQIIGTIHNPVRASTVAGVDVTDRWYDPDFEIAFTPESVDVSGDEIRAAIAVVRSVAAGRLTATGDE